MKNILKFCLLAISIFHPLADTNATDNTENCQVNQKRFELKQVFIRDSSICKILDSSLSFIRIEKNQYEIPTSYSLWIKSTKREGVLDLKFLALNSYGWLNLNQSIPNGYYALAYKGNQIILSIPDTLVNAFFSLTEKKINVYAYTLTSEENENSYCFQDKNIDQEVSFLIDLRIGKSRFTFRQYKYSVLHLPISSE